MVNRKNQFSWLVRFARGGRHSFVWRYGLALLLTLGAVLLRQGLSPILRQSMPFAFCSLAIAASAALGGWGPGLLATGLSALLTDYWFLEPRGSLALTGSHVLGEVITFLVLGVLISLIIDALRRAWRRERSQEERFRETVETADEGIWMTDLQGRTTFVNRRMAELLGYTEQEMLGRPFADFVCPAAQPHYETFPREPLDGGGEHAELRLCRKDGRERWFWVNTTTLGDKAWPGEIIGLFRDVTERREAAEALARREAEFRVLFERASIGKVQVDPATGRFLRVNRKFAEIVGYSEQELLGMTLFHVLYPEDRESFQANCSRLLRGELSEYTTERRYVRGGDGRVIWVEVLVNLIRASGGQPLYTIASVQDITRRKQMEETLRESEARYRQVIHSAGAVIIGVNLAGRITMYSGYAEQLFGFTASEVMGRPVVGTLVPPRDSAGREMQAAIADLLHNVEQHLYQENENMTKDGRLLWVGWTNRPILEADGTVREIVCVGLDLTGRKRTEEALRLSEERFRAIFEHAALGLEQVSMEGRLLEVNDALCRMLGYSREELLVKTAAEITHPDDRAAEARILRPLLLGETPHCQIEKRYLRRDGEPVWVRVTSSLTRPPQPCRISIVEDISTRVQADHLQRERTFLRQVIDAAPSMIFVKDREGRFILVNEALAYAYGTDVDGVVGKTDRDFNPNAEELEHFSHDDLQVMNCQQRLLIPEEKVSFANGEVHWFSTIKVPLLGEDGSCDMVLGVASDITARKEAEDALRQSEAQYRTLMETIPQMIWTIQPNGVHDFCNHFWHDYTGLSLEETIHSGWANAMHPDEAPYAVAAWQRAFELSQPLETEGRLRRAADGAYRWHYTRIIPIRDAEGRIVQWIGTAMDIHELHAAQDALREANTRLAEADRHKDEFLAMLAHELRNPLAPIRNAVQILNTFCGSICPNMERMARQRRIIDRQVTHMARLLDDLLDVSRVTRGMIALQRRPLLLADVLAQAVETAAPLIEGRRQELHFTPPEGALAVEGDPDRLAQVVGNLLSNAAKYTDASGEIWLEAGEEDGSVVIRVRDTGVGIAPEMLERVFELFAQADQSLGRSRGGLGIGLTMVRRLVELHGGRVEARSAGLGQGSEFIVRLPALPAWAAPRPAAPLESAHLPGACRPRRILVVDDVADTAESLAELLESWGHEVRTAHNGLAALELAVSYRPEVVLLDIGMPGMDGYEVARRLRQMPEEAGAQLVALTGYGQEQDREATRQAGFDLHLVKPVNLAALRELLAFQAA